MPVMQEITCNAGDMGLIPGLGRSPGGGHGNPLQYACLENPISRGAWWATVHEVTELGMTEQLNNSSSKALRLNVIKEAPHVGTKL